MIVRKTMYKKDELTEAQIKEIEEAAKRPIVYDDDSPKMTPEMEKAFLVAARIRNRNRDRNKDVG